jgi:predicted amidohydrolase YtcJ
MSREYALRGIVSDVGQFGRVASVVHVKDGLVAGVGGHELLEALESSGVPIVDLGDRFISPGFVDAHTHFEDGARSLVETLDCRVPVVHDIAALLERLRAHLHHAVDGWLVAQGNLFYDKKLADGRFPTMSELDSVSTDIAIAIRAGGHATMMNSVALERSGVLGFENREGMMGDAVIERDENGELTGLIAELDAAVPFPKPAPGEIPGILRDKAAELYTRFGVTSIGDISASPAGVDAMETMAAAEELPIRVTTYLWAPGTMAFDEAIRRAASVRRDVDPDRFAIRGLKVFADGGFSSRNAAVHTPYLDRASDDGAAYTGTVSIDHERLTEMVRSVRRNGLQLAVHANGERAQEAACHAAIAAGSPEDESQRVRVEHAGNFLTRTASLDLWREAQILPVLQAGFLVALGDYFVPIFGPEVADSRFRFRDLIDAGIRPAGSSDLFYGSEPEQTSPLFNIWCSVARLGFGGEAIAPEQRITLDEAWTMHTLWAASALGVEDRRGSLEVGKVADIAVLARDPHDVSVDELRHLAVDVVIVGGECVLRLEGLEGLDAIEPAVSCSVV